MKAISVYDKAWPKRRLAVLENAYDISYTQQTNAVWTASFKLPYNDFKNKFCRPLNYVKIWDVDAGNTDRCVGLFRIMPVELEFGTIEKGSYYTYELEHVMGTLMDDIFIDYEIPEPELVPGPGPPIMPQPVGISVSQPLSSGQLMHSYTINNTGHKDRYMLLMFMYGDPNIPEPHGRGEWTAISLGGRAFTKITQGGTIIGSDGSTAVRSGTVTQIWGCTIPDSWHGTYSFNTTKWGPNGPRPYIIVLQNVNPQNPIVGSDSFYRASSGSLNATLHVPCSEGGAVYSVLSLRNEGTLPTAGSGNTQIHANGISRLTSPTATHAATMHWSWSPGSRNSHSVVSLRSTVTAGETPPEQPEQPPVVNAFEQYSVGWYLEGILGAQTKTNWYLNECDYDDVLDYDLEPDFEEVSLIECLRYVVQWLSEDYYWKFNTDSYPWHLSLKKVSETPVTDIRYRKNMFGITRTEDPRSLCTKLYLFGARLPESEDYLDISSVNNGLRYIFSEEGIGEYGTFVMVLRDNRFESAEDLLKYGEIVLSKLDKPFITYEADIQTIYNAANLKIGDAVRIVTDEGLDDVLIVQEISKSDVTGSPVTGKVTIGQGTVEIGLIIKSFI